MNALLSTKNKQQYTSWLIILTLLIVMSCVLQQSGLISSCPSIAAHEAESSHVIVHTEKCDSAEHLLNWFSAHVDAFVSLFVVLLLALGSRLYSRYFAIQRHPRAPPVRQHLLFCVFQE